MVRSLMLCLLAIYTTADFTVTAQIENPETNHEVKCKEDGFLPNPKNCREFFWCSLRRSASRAIILECETDQIFDTQTQKCKYPWESTREECGGTLRMSNEVADNLPVQEAEESKFRNALSDCAQEGFMADENDCSKFYRCVDDGRGKFMKYEFSCAPGTVWDPEINSCNHPWATKNPKCGGKVDSSNSEQNYSEVPDDGDNTNYVEEVENPKPILNPNENVPNYPNYQQGQVNPYPGEYQPSYPSQSNLNNNPYQEVPSTTSTSLKPSTNYPTSNQPVDSNNNYNNQYPSNNGYNPYEEVSSTSSTTNKPTPDYAVSRQPDTSNISNQFPSQEPPTAENDINNAINKPDNNCQEEGFMGDTKDCRKFYRCVANGNEKFLKYEFSCGEGTVWDSEINSCNHEWAVKTKNCKSGDSNNVSEGTNSNPDMSGEYGPYPSSSDVNYNPDNNINPDNPNYPNNVYPPQYGFNPQQSSKQPPYQGFSTTGISSTTSVPISSTTITNIITTNTPPNGANLNQPTSSNNCTEEDFIADSENCKKFYRCVKGDNNKFIKYEFTCGEGTIWDSEEKTCNYPWAVKSKCGTANNNLIESTTHTDINTSSTSKTTISSSSENSPSQPEKVTPSIIDISSTTTNLPSDSSSTTTTTDSSSNQHNNQSSNIYDECLQDGFIGDSKNCQKFYRCVDNGKGGFTKYDFTCGEGTVWDIEQSTCNFPWAVKNKCNITSLSNPETSSQTNEINNSTEISSTEQTQTISSSTETSSENANTGLAEENDCVKEGFVEDENNCMKFYRCVNNGQNRFIKYEFTCGEGTIWDSELETCNYPSAVKSGKCTPNEISSPSTDLPMTQTTARNSEYTNQTPSSTLITQTSEPQNESTLTTTAKTNALTSPSTVITQTNEYTTGITSTESSKNITSSSLPTSSTTLQASSSSQTESSSYSTENSSGPTTELIESSKPTQSTETSKPTESSKPTEPTESPKPTELAESSKPTQSTETSKLTESSKPTESTESPKPTESAESSKPTQSTETSKPTESSKPSESTESSKTTEATESSKPTETTKPSESTTEKNNIENKDNTCTKEGFMPHSTDCNKFIRCVSNGKGFTKYEFSCGPGTIWDPDLDTCNHPYAVKTRNCNKPQGEVTSGNQNETSTESPGSLSMNETKDKCTTEGFHPSSKNCKNFYRCVSNGQNEYIKYDFTCGEGTIWDPNLETCNYPSATVNTVCGHSGSNKPESTESSVETTTLIETTTEVGSITTPLPDATTEKNDTISTVSPDTTTNAITTEKSEATTKVIDQITTHLPTTTDVTSETTENSNTITTTISDISTTESESTISTTDSNEVTTTVDSNERTTTTDSNEKTTTAEFTEKTTTESTEKTTTESTDKTTSTDFSESTTLSNESTTTTKNEETTLEVTTSPTEEKTTTTKDITTTIAENQTELSTTEVISSTTEIDSSTTEISLSTTESTSPSNQTVCEVAQLEDDQITLICPTGFKRHPKYCNLFYQCTNSAETMEIKILVLRCPDGTIFDEQKIQCLSPEESSQTCKGEISEKPQLRQINPQESLPMEIGMKLPLCPNVGTFPLDSKKCLNGFIKCQAALSEDKKMQGYVHQCPSGYTYWPISKRCERQSSALGCAPEDIIPGRSKWMIPVEVRKA